MENGYVKLPLEEYNRLKDIEDIKGIEDQEKEDLFDGILSVIVSSQELQDEILGGHIELKVSKSAFESFLRNRYRKTSRAPYTIITQTLNVSTIEWED